MYPNILKMIKSTAVLNFTLYEDRNLLVLCTAVSPAARMVCNMCYTHKTFVEYLKMEFYVAIAGIQKQFNIFENENNAFQFYLNSSSFTFLIKFLKV